jgi:hypothetical protein
MKNSELLTSKRQNLSSIEKQRQFLLRCLIQKNACPNCARQFNFFEAAGIDVDDWHGVAGDTPCRCTACKRELIYVVPFLAIGGNGGWHWQLVPIVSKE